MSASWRIEVGDCRDLLATLPAATAHTCVTSPPYFGLRDYGTGEWEGGDPACDHLGRPMRTNDKATVPHSERGPTTFHGGTARGTEPWKDGTCGKCGARRVDRQIGLEPTVEQYVSDLCDVFDEVRRVMRDDATLWCNLGDSFGPGKQLLGVPWRVAFALQARGWCLRSDVIWAKLAEPDAGERDGPADESARVRVPAVEGAAVLL